MTLPYMVKGWGEGLILMWGVWAFYTGVTFLQSLTTLTLFGHVSHKFMGNLRDACPYKVTGEGG